MCPLEILITVKLIGEEKFYQDNYHNVENMIYWSFIKISVIINNYPIYWSFMKFPVIINNYPIHWLFMKFPVIINNYPKIHLLIYMNFLLFTSK